MNDKALKPVGEADVLKAWVVYYLLPMKERAVYGAILAVGCALPVVASASDVRDPADMLGGGNVSIRGDLEKLKILNEVGMKMCRIPLQPDQYWGEGSATPERLDEGLLAVLEHGVSPVILFEYYTRHHVPLGDYDQWKAIGFAFAERFGPNSAWLLSRGIRNRGIRYYTAINEPMWKENNPEPLPVEAYVRALEGLADGVHQADAGLKVAAGGFQEVPLFQRRNPYIQGLVPLYNRGKLAAIDIHRYWDVEWVPMSGTRRFTLQKQFEAVKYDLGLTADVAFWTTEFNFKKRLVDEEQAASGLLTAIWDALAVVGARGQSVTEFAMPWNVFHEARRDPHFGMAATAEPWTPTARGEVLMLVCRLSADMELVSLDPNGEGVFVLAGRERRLWVWQNRQGWSASYGSSHKLTGVPPQADTLRIYGWDGLLRTLPLSGESAVTVHDLPTDQTLMFLASSGHEEGRP